MKLIYNLSLKKNNNTGKKAKNLLLLKRRGILIPETYILPFKTYNLYLANNNQIYKQLKVELRRVIKPGNLYAIRSSANIEDSSELSYAGQFESILNVTSIENIIYTVEKIWESAKSSKVSEYSKNMNMLHANVKMAVIIQKMIKCEYAGIAFSKNPMTGLNETIIECIKGGAEQLTQTGETPYRWVKKWGSWSIKPDKSNIPIDIINKVYELVCKIEKIFKYPVDIEWAYENGSIYILQARKITEIDIPIYSNKISREMLPGIIKPLVWSVNTNLINPTWARLINSMTGIKNINNKELTGYFYNRAYFNMGIFGRIFKKIGLPGDALELMMGLDSEGTEKPKFKPSLKTLLILPRFLLFVMANIRLGKKCENFISVSKKDILDTTIDNIKNISTDNIIKEINRVSEIVKKIAHYTIVIPLLSSIYNKLTEKQFIKAGVKDKFNYHIDDKEHDDIKPYIVIEKLHKKYFAEDSEMVSFNKIKENEDFISFINKFGHFSDSGNDISYVPWRESPELVYQMIKNYDISIKGKVNVELDKVTKIISKKILVRTLYKKSVKYSLYRDKISSLYTFGYGMLRPLFVEIGLRFTESGLINEIDDIFYLFDNEIYNCVKNQKCESFKLKIQKRKREIIESESLLVPTTIYGDKAPPILNKKDNLLQGIPTSHGFYIGKAKVLKGIKQMNKLEVGNVLVIPYSDVGWTPLFSKAGAVVSESGGILSHSSIVAREYHIPAVVSVTGACDLEDNTIISVNGFTGEIGIINVPGSEEVKE